MNADAKITPPRQPKCPTCGKPVLETKHRPFCSGRCRDVDLGRWFTETYRVETNEPDGEIEQ